MYGLIYNAILFTEKYILATIKTSYLENDDEEERAASDIDFVAR